MQKVATTRIRRNPSRLIRNVGKVINKSHGTLIHLQERRLERLAVFGEQFICPTIAVSPPLIRASETMQARTNCPPEMQVMREMDFLRG